MVPITQLWGKTGIGGAFHPAVFHMVDAGHVAGRLLGSEGPPRFRQVLARAFGIADPDTLVDWLPLVVALHDLGKISTSFQKQASEQHQRLADLGLSFPNTSRVKAARHQHVSAVAIRHEFLHTRLTPLAPLEQILVDVAGGHHGWFAEPGSTKHANTLITRIEWPEWHAFRQDTVTLLLDAFPLLDDLNLTEAPNERAATLALTGFVILCDWIASDSALFPLSPDVTFDDYIPISRQRAIRAVSTAGFAGVRTPAAWSGFKSVFPNIEHPRPLQHEVDHLPLTDEFEPALIIIEAPTGEGKTETALALSRRMAASGASDEMYVALPTMATSNQMYGRVLDFLQRTSGQGTTAKLIHGQAFLVEDDLNLRFTGNPQDEESPAAAAPDWFAPRKRALLAPFGVGTVDQAELAVLSARHYMLRLFGLAGKVVIIDEVHAYDAYMSTIIDHALSWLAALGSPVILLSATLPATRHREMAAAYQSGLPGHIDAPDGTMYTETLAYPVIATYTANAQHVSSPAASQPARALQLRMVNERSPEEEARYLLETVSDGGAVCRITNTVRRAQEIYRALVEIAPDSVQRHLIHARLPLDERLPREEVVARLLGPESCRSIDDRIIVVGTQVLEQSLDYDVDRMISDLAPIDLLLQRAGRLHRHAQRAGVRPPRLHSPVLEVITGAPENGLPELGDSAHVYQAAILFQSWITLHKRSNPDGTIDLTLPGDYRPLIEEVYAQRFDTLPADHPGYATFQEAVSQWSQTTRNMLDDATQRLVPDVRRARPITEGKRMQFQEDEDGTGKGWGSAATRYGEQSIMLIPLHRVPGGVAIEPGGAPINALSNDRELQLRLLRRGIRVGNKRLVHQLPGMFAADLPGWSDARLLRNHHPFVLDSGELWIGGLRVCLHPELGLTYEYPKGESQ